MDLFRSFCIRLNDYAKLCNHSELSKFNHKNDYYTAILLVWYKRAIKWVFVPIYNCIIRFNNKSYYFLWVWLRPIWNAINSIWFQFNDNDLLWFLQINFFFKFNFNWAHWEWNTKKACKNGAESRKSRKNQQIYHLKRCTPFERSGEQERVRRIQTKGFIEYEIFIGSNIWRTCNFICITFDYRVFLLLFNSMCRFFRVQNYVGE